MEILCVRTELKLVEQYTVYKLDLVERVKVRFEFKPCSNLEIIRRVFRNLIMSFDKMGEHEKAEEVKELLLLIADGADLGV